MSRLFDALPVGGWACWDRPPVMYVCYDADGCSFYPMDTGVEAHGPFPLFSWEYALAPDGRGGLYVTGGHDENLQVRVQDPYSVGHSPPFPDSSFGPMISELWHYDVRRNAWKQVDQESWGPRQCVGGRHMTYDPLHDCLVRTAACREGHSPRPAVPLRGWGIFGLWRYELNSRRWAWMRPCESMGPLTYDTRRDVVLGCKDGVVGVYDVHSNAARRRPEAEARPRGEGAFAYDRKHDVCLFYGESGEIWIYDVEANAWSHRRPRPRPKPRKGFGFALDPNIGKALLFGGRAKAKYFGDTWVYSVEKNRWRQVRCRMKPEGRFWSGPGIVYDEVNRAFVLYGGLAAYERVKARYAPGDVWIFRLPQAKQKRPRQLPAPRLRVACRPKSVRIDWAPVRGAAGYVVERGSGEPGAVCFEPLTRLPVEATSYRDRSPEPGVRCEYRVRAVRANGRRGTWSAPARTDPAVPTGLVVSVLGSKRVEAAWAPSPEPNVVAYRLRRMNVVGNDRFTGERIIEVGRHTSCRDAPAGLPRRHYQYQVQAVNRLGVASGWSAPAGTIPSAPAKLGITPDRRTRSITLRWPANPEKGIVGYNLYRWVEPPFRFAFKAEPELITPAWWGFDGKTNPPERMKWVQVNEKPIAGTRFVDKGLKLVTTWYYIRAVNRLGVEGHYRTTYAMPVWRWYANARQVF